jgi:ATP-dependent protease ClpP protease subunit
MKANSGNNGGRKPSSNKGGLNPIDFNATSYFTSARSSFPGTSSAYIAKPDLKFPSSTRTFTASFAMPTMSAMPSFAKFSSATSTSVVLKTGYGAQNYRPSTATIKMEFSFSLASNELSKLSDRFNKLEKNFKSLTDGQSSSARNSLYDSQFARMAFRLEFPLVNYTTKILKGLMGAFIPNAYASENHNQPQKGVNLELYLDLSNIQIAQIRMLPEEIIKDDQRIENIIKNMKNMKLGDNLILIINSRGGDGSCMESIIEAIKNTQGKVTAYVDGLAASAAAEITIECHDVFFTPGSTILFHKSRPGSSIVPGDSFAQHMNSLMPLLQRAKLSRCLTNNQLKDIFDNNKDVVIDGKTMQKQLCEKMNKGCQYVNDPIFRLSPQEKENFRFEFK